MKYISPRAFYHKDGEPLSREALRAGAEIYVYELIRNYLRNENRLRSLAKRSRIQLSRDGYKALRERFLKNLNKGKTVEYEVQMTQFMNDISYVMDPSNASQSASKIIYKRIMNTIHDTFSDFQDFDCVNQDDVKALQSISKEDLGAFSAESLWSETYAGLHTKEALAEEAWYGRISPIDPVYMNGNSTVESETPMGYYLVRKLEGEYYKSDGTKVVYHDVTSDNSKIYKQVWYRESDANGQLTGPWLSKREAVPNFYNEDDLYNITWLKRYASPSEMNQIRSSMKNLNPAMAMPTEFNAYGELILDYLEKNGYEYSVIPGKAPGQVECVIKGSSSIRVRIMDTHYAYDKDGNLPSDSYSNLGYLGRVYVNRPYGVEYYWNATGSQNIATRMRPEYMENFLKTFTPEVALIPLRYALGESVDRAIDGAPLGSVGYFAPSANAKVKTPRSMSYCVSDKKKDKRTVNMAYDAYLNLHGRSLWYGKSANSIFYTESEVEAWKRDHHVTSQEDIDLIADDNYFEKELNLDGLVKAAETYQNDPTAFPAFSQDERIQSIQRAYFYYLTNQLNALDSVGMHFGEEFMIQNDVANTLNRKNLAYQNAVAEDDMIGFYTYKGLTGMPDEFKTIVNYSIQDDNGTYQTITEEEYHELLEENRGKEVMIEYITPEDDLYGVIYNDLYDDSMSERYYELKNQLSQNRETIVREHAASMIDYARTMDFDTFNRQNLIIPKTAEEFLRDSITMAKENATASVNLEQIAEIADRYNDGDKDAEPVWSENDLIETLQRQYFDYLTGRRKYLPQPASEMGSGIVPFDVSEFNLIETDTESMLYKQQVANYHLKKTLDAVVIGDYDTKFDPGHVAAFSPDNQVYQDSIMRAMYSLNMDTDRVLNVDSVYNRTICDGLIHFNPDSAVSLADLKAQNVNSMQRRMMQVVYDTLNTNACSVLEDDILIDENGIVEYTAKRRYGKDASMEQNELITGHLGQIFEPNEAGVIYTKYHASDQRVYVPGYNAHILPRADAYDRSSMFERMRLIGYEQMMQTQIQKTLRASIIADNSTTRDDVQAFNYVYHHMPNDAYSVDEFERRWNDESLDTREVFRATVATMTRKIRLSNTYKEYSTMQAQAKILAGQMDNPNFEEDILTGNVKDNFDYRWWNRTGHNICEIANYADGYVDKDLTSTGTSQGAIMYLTDDTIIHPDGSMTPGDPETSRTAVMKTDVMKYCEFDGSDRITMAGMQLMTAKKIERNVKTAMIPLNGWGYDDAFIISKEFAEKASFTTDDGEVRSVHVGDKLADMHGNKGVTSIIIDRNMSDAEADKRHIREVRDFMRANPSLECIVSPYSGPSRNNGGTIRELYESEHEDLIIPGENGEPDKVIKAGIGELNIIVTDKLGDEKSHVYSDTMDVSEEDGIYSELGDDIARKTKQHALKGRKLSAQLAMAFQAKDCRGILKEAYGPNQRNYKDTQDYMTALGITLTDDGVLELRETTEDDIVDEMAIIRLPKEDDSMFSTYERKVYEFEMNPDGTFKLDAKGNKIKVMEQDENGNMVPKVIKTVKEYDRNKGATMGNMGVFQRVLLSGDITNRLSEKLSVKAGYLELPFPLLYPTEHGASTIPFNKEFTHEDGDTVKHYTMNEVLNSGDIELYERALKESGFRYTAMRGEDYLVGAYTDEYQGVERPGVKIPSYRLPLLSESLRHGIQMNDDEFVMHNYTIQYRSLLRIALNYCNLKEAEYYVKNYYVPDAIDKESDKEIAAKRKKVNAATDEAEKEKLLQELDELKLSKTDASREVILDGIHKRMSGLVRSAQKDYNTIVNDILDKHFNTKYNVVRENVMARRTKDSATIVWTPNPTLDVNQVGFGKTMADKMGLSEDETIVLWRDPILSPGNVRGMKVHILEDDIDVISIHPLMDKSYDGDFDGDSGGLWKMHTAAAIRDAEIKLSQEHNLADTTVGREGNHPLYINDGMETTPNTLNHPELAEQRDRLEKLANEIRLGDLNHEDTSEKAKQALELANDYTKAVMKGIAGDYIAFESPQSIAEGVKRFSESGAKGNISKGYFYLVNCVSMDVEGELENGVKVNHIYGDDYKAVMDAHKIDLGESDMDNMILRFEDKTVPDFDMGAWIQNNSSHPVVTETFVKQMFMSETPEISLDILAQNVPEFDLYYNAHKIVNFDESTAEMRADDQTGITLDMRNTQQKAQGVKTFDTALAGTHLQRFMTAFRNVFPEAAMEITRGSTQGVLQSKHDADAAVEKDNALRYWSREIMNGRVLADPENSDFTLSDALKAGYSPSQIRNITWKPLCVAHDKDGTAHVRVCGNRGKTYKNNMDVTQYIYASKEESINQLKAYLTAMESDMNDDYIENIFEAVYSDIDAYKAEHADEYAAGDVPEIMEDGTVKPVLKPSVMSYIDVFGSTMDKIAYGDHWNELYQAAKDHKDLFKESCSFDYMPKHVKNPSTMVSYKQMVRALISGQEYSVQDENSEFYGMTMTEALSEINQPNSRFGSTKELLEQDWKRVKVSKTAEDGHVYEKPKYMTFKEKRQNIQMLFKHVLPTMPASSRTEFLEKAMRPFIHETMAGHTLYTAERDENGRVVFETDANGKPTRNPSMISFEEANKLYNKQNHTNKGIPMELILTYDWTITPTEGSTAKCATKADLKAQYRGCFHGMGISTVSSSMLDRTVDAVSTFTKEHHFKNKSLTRYMEHLLDYPFKNSSIYAMKQAVILNTKSLNLSESAKERTKAWEKDMNGLAQTSKIAGDVPVLNPDGMTRSEMMRQEVEDEIAAVVSDTEDTHDGLQ